MSFEEEPIKVEEKRNDYVTLIDPLGLATLPWWEEPPLVKLANKEEEVIFIFESDPTFVLIILHDEEGVYMSQRKHPNKPMYLKYQVLCGKVERGETSLEAAQRETQEETNLRIPIKAFNYIGNDPAFNCNMYTVRLYEDEVPELTEPHNMTVWMYYPWNTWYQMALEGRTTPSLTTYRDLIWDQTR